MRKRGKQFPNGLICAFATEECLKANFELHTYKFGRSYLGDMVVIISVPDAVVVGVCSVMAAAVT